MAPLAPPVDAAPVVGFPNKFVSITLVINLAHIKQLIFNILSHHLIHVKLRKRFIHALTSLLYKFLP